MERPTGLSLLTRLSLFAGINDVIKLLALATVLRQYISILPVLVKGWFIKVAILVQRLVIGEGFVWEYHWIISFPCFPVLDKKNSTESINHEGEEHEVRHYSTLVLMSGKAGNSCASEMIDRAMIFLDSCANEAITKQLCELSGTQSQSRHFWNGMGVFHKQTYSDWIDFH